MASLGKLLGLTHEEYADLEERVDRFYSAWAPDGSSELESYLPAPGSRHRPHVLVEMIKTDMGRRVRAGLSIRVESYLARFPHDIPVGTPPVSLLTEEYWLRHRYADRPGVDEFRSRFPALADALAKQLHNGTATAPPKSPRAGTIGLDADSSRPASRDTAGLGMKLTPPIGKSPPPPPAAAQSPADVLPAELQYQLGKQLGAGTFGEVYEAIAPGGFRVAVKRIHRAVDHPASKGEIKALDAMKTLRHPFLIQTHAYWVFRDRLVIVMELADDSLAGRVEHHKAHGRPGVPPDELVPFFEQAADALDYLHSQNVSHRDVKPENLLLLKGYAKVADFGLAREHEHLMTKVDAEVGTPCYMAPEVWRRNVSLHSDQYSLAATYVMARLGRPMFSAKTLPELCVQHMQETPDLGPLPPEERRVLLKALAKTPDARYPSCGAFVAALRAAAFPPPAPRRFAAVGWATAVALLIGVVIGLTVFALKPSPTNSEQKPIAICCPPNWTVPADAETVPLPSGLVAPKRLTRMVGDTELELRLVPHTRPGDPLAFYMLRNKVSNRVFRAVWKKADENPNSRLNEFRKRLTKDMEKALLPGKWKEGAIDHTGRSLGSVGEQEDVPVVGVTAAEAMLVAEELGGQLPTYRQWWKATGANGEEERDSPAGAKEGDNEDLTTRPLALGLKYGPWPVTRETKDLSCHGIHQLVSNVYEWADGEDEPERVSLFASVGAAIKLPLTGETWETPSVLTFGRFPDQRSKKAYWYDTEQLVGFRVVVPIK